MKLRSSSDAVGGSTRRRTLSLVGALNVGAGGTDSILAKARQRACVAVIRALFDCYSTLQAIDYDVVNNRAYGQTPYRRYNPRVAERSLRGYN